MDGGIRKCVPSCLSNKLKKIPHRDKEILTTGVSGIPLVGDPQP